MDNGPWVVAPGRVSVPSSSARLPDGGLRRADRWRFARPPLLARHGDGATAAFAIAHRIAAGGWVRVIQSSPCAPCPARNHLCAALGFKRCPDRLWARSSFEVSADQVSAPVSRVGRRLPISFVLSNTSFRFALQRRTACRDGRVAARASGPLLSCRLLGRLSHRRGRLRSPAGRPACRLA